MTSFFRKLALSAPIIPLAQCAVVPGHNSAAAGKPPHPRQQRLTVKPALWAVNDEHHRLSVRHRAYAEARTELVRQRRQRRVRQIGRTQARTLPKTNEVAKETMALALDQSGTALSSRLDPAALTAYQAAMTSKPAARQLRWLQAVVAGITLSVLPLTKMGYNPEEGAEKQLSNAAKAARQADLRVRNAQRTARLFRCAADVNQIAFLNVMVKDLDKLGPQLGRDGRAMGGRRSGCARRNDERGLAETPDVAKTLLWDRNARWAEQIEARMAQPGAYSSRSARAIWREQGGVQDCRAARS